MATIDIRENSPRDEITGIIISDSLSILEFRDGGDTFVLCCDNEIDVIEIEFDSIDHLIDGLQKVKELRK